MLRPLASLAALAVASGLAAQEMPAGSPYADAAARFYLPGVVPGAFADWADEAAVVALLPTLEGTWLRGAQAVAGGAEPPAPDLLARACDQVGATLARTSPRSFEVRVPIGDGADSYAERYDFVTGTTFLRSFDEAGYLRRLLGDAAATPEGLARLPEGLVGRTLAQAGRGEVMLFAPSPDLLVLVQMGRPPDLWMRCP